MASRRPTHRKEMQRLSARTSAPSEAPLVKVPIPIGLMQVIQVRDVSFLGRLPFVTETADDLIVERTMPCMIWDPVKLTEFLRQMCGQRQR